MAAGSTNGKKGNWMELGLLVCMLAACSEAPEVSPQRFAAVDQLVQQVTNNINESGLTLVADIDHARLGAEAGSPMAPARVLIFSDGRLDAAFMSTNPLAGVDLPLRVLVFDDEGEARFIYNEFDYVASRYGLREAAAEPLREAYNAAMQSALRGLPEQAQSLFESNTMEPDGINTITSPFSHAETVERVMAAIDSQDDAMHFGRVDFQAAAAEQGVQIAPAVLILFGAPGPGGQAMLDAPTLGLDAFCQKFLIWEDAAGNAHLSFNDLLSVAERQKAEIALPLRVINFRLTSVFEEALIEE